MKRTITLGSMLLIIFMVLLYFSCGTSSYKYVRVQETLASGKSKNLTAEELKTESFLKKSAEIPLCASYFKQFFKTAYLIVEGFDNLHFTVKIENGKTTVTRGIDPDGNPDLVIPLDKQNCENIYHILKDGEISDEEEYRIFNVTFIPSYKDIMNKEAIYNPKIAKKMALPNFMQVVLKNENNYIYKGSTRELTVTIVTVDGQWLIFEGSIGDPDVRYEVTVKQAKEFTSLLVQSSSGSKEELLELLDKIKLFLEKTTVYTRK